MCFNLLMGRSLERAGVGRLGSGEGWLCGGVCKRVRVPSWFKIMWSAL